MAPYLANVGRKCLTSIHGLGTASLLLLRAINCIFGRWPRRNVIAFQFYSIGILSLPVIIGTGAFTGMVLAVSTYYQMHRLQVDSLIGAVVNVSLVKQLGPILTSSMLAGRVGSAIAAELGTMKVTEQIDAMRAMGADPVKHLVFPRFLAIVLLSPILCLISEGVGMLAGWVVAVKGFNIENHFYWEQCASYLVMFDIWHGLIKSVFFGIAIAIICCFKGLNAYGGAEGVGRATTEATTMSFMAILVLNFFLTVFLQMFEVRMV